MTWTWIRWWITQFSRQEVLSTSSVLYAMKCLWTLDCYPVYIRFARDVWRTLSCLGQAHSAARLAEQTCHSQWVQTISSFVIFLFFIMTLSTLSRYKYLSGKGRLLRLRIAINLVSISTGMEITMYRHLCQGSIWPYIYRSTVLSFSSFMSNKTSSFCFVSNFNFMHNETDNYSESK